MEGVHYFVRGLFRGIKENEHIAEQREELETHINDRIADSMAAGLSEKEAFASVVDSLGNLDELIDTMTGEKIKVFIGRMNWYILSAALVYGTAYMLAVGVWFYYMGFGQFSIYVVIPGWLGYVLPAVNSCIEFKKNPLKTAVIPVTFKNDIRKSLFGWAGITLACWIANTLLIPSDTFLSVIWAWIPTFGLLTGPLMTLAKYVLVRKLPSILPGSE